MAIVTREEIKTLLQITANTYDSLIDSLIPIAEFSFLKVRGIDFFMFEADLTSGSQIIEILSTAAMQVIKRSNRIETREDNGANMRGRVAFIDYDDFDVTLDSASGVTEDQAEMIMYPGNSDYVMSKIVAWMMSKDNATGMKNETFGTYNYTKFDPASGLPTDIAKMIEQYQTGHE